MNRKPKIKSDRKINGWKLFYKLSFIVGLILIILEIFLYRKTIINVFIPASILLAVGTVTFILNKNHFNKTNNTKGVFYAFLQNTCSWGFMICYLFMATNYYFAEKELRIEEFEIKSKSSLLGRRLHRAERKPTVLIDYYGFDKELIFSNNQTQKVERANKIILTIRRGLYGYEILENYDTVEKE